ncbi:Versican core protein, partial [Bienertia sinuspersici]
TLNLSAGLSLCHSLFYSLPRRPRRPAFFSVSQISLTQNQILKISQEILLQQQVSSRIFNYNSRSLFFKIRVLVVGFGTS